MWDNVSLIFYLHRADLTIKVDRADPRRKKVWAFYFFSSEFTVNKKGLWQRLKVPLSHTEKNLGQMVFALVTELWLPLLLRG